MSLQALNRAKAQKSKIDAPPSSGFNGPALSRGSTIQYATGQIPSNMQQPRMQNQPVFFQQGQMPPQMQQPYYPQGQIPPQMQPQYYQQGQMPQQMQQPYYPQGQVPPQMQPMQTEMTSNQSQQIKFPNKLSISDAVGLITLRLGYVEKWIKEYSESNDSEENNPNEMPVINTLIEKISAIEKKMETIDELKKGFEEIKTVIDNLSNFELNNEFQNFEKNYINDINDDNDHNNAIMISGVIKQNEHSNTLIIE